MKTKNEETMQNEREKDENLPLKKRERKSIFWQCKLKEKIQLKFTMQL